jgi:serine/threonine protein kinase
VLAANHIAKIVAGIALAMRFVHSRDVIHPDLTPDNILLDWNWSVRIADFGGSASPTERRTVDPHKWPSIDSHYLAPECDDGHFTRASDVFAFGLILFEIITRQPAFSKRLHQHQFAWQVVVKKRRPDIPEFVLPPVGALISDCWADDPDDRPPFEEIVELLADIEFTMTPNVDSVKVKRFVKRIEEWEMGERRDSRLPI